MGGLGKDWRVVSGALVVAAATLVVVERFTRRERRRRRVAARCDARVTALHRFPVKGLGFDVLSSCDLSPGGCFPNDRAWGLLRREELSNFNPRAPSWIHKMKFYAACSSAQAMARLQSSYVDASDTLTIRDRQCGATLLETQLRTKSGRAKAEAFFSTFLTEAEGTKADVALVSSDEGALAYQFGNTTSGIQASGNEKTVHLVSLATVRDLGRAVGEVIDSLRFRGNVLFDGLDAWEEFEWVGRTVAIGDEVRLKVVKRTIRCEATCMDLNTAQKALNIPGALSKHFPQHGPYLGVYAQVIRGGRICPGDTIREAGWW